MLIPHQLTILTTSQCTTSCAHCCVSSSPNRRERLSSRDMQRAIDGVRGYGHLGLVIFAGGEPTLLGESLLDAIAYANAYGLITRLVTNASWATTARKAQSKIVELREAGLQELNISADDFHLPDIPFNNVENAWYGAQGKGFLTVCVGVAWGPQSHITPDTVRSALGAHLPIITFDTRVTEDTIPPSEDGTMYAIHSSRLQLIGRGGAQLDREAAIPVEPQELDGLCPFAVRAPTLSPKNHLVACCGIEAEGNPVLDFGVTDNNTFAELFCRAEDDVLIQAISRLGPKFLLDLVCQINPSLLPKYNFRSVCEICEYVTTSDTAVGILRAHANDIANELICKTLDKASSYDD